MDSYFSREHLQAIEAAIASGILEVRRGDKTTRYQDTAHLIRVRNLIIQELDKQAGTTNGSTTYAEFSRD